MPPFSVTVKNPAAKFIRRQDAKTQQRLKQKIEIIAANPFDVEHSKMLANHGGLRSARVGKFRIIFSVALESQSIEIQIIDSRGQVYDRLS